MKSKKVTRYYCDFCGIGMGSAKNMRRHEERCFKNTVSRSCITCQHVRLWTGRRHECSVRALDLSERLQTNCHLWQPSVAAEAEGVIDSFDLVVRSIA